MFSRKKSVETEIPVQLEEPLTTDSCLKVVMELLKYLLYEKEQIPFSYDSMQLYKMKIQPGDKNYSSFEKLFTSLDTLSKELTSQFYIRGCDMKEVVIAFGATINTPRIIVRVELPSKILNSRRHKGYQHSSRKPLINLMRSMCECEELQGALTMPLGLTNTFVMIQKSDPSKMSSFFLPKPDYRLSTTARKFRIKLVYNDECLSTKCECPNVVDILNDSANLDELELSPDDFERSDNFDVGYQWYQSKEVIKGFKYL